jgi:hypothetical protein
LHTRLKMRNNGKDLIRGPSKFQNVSKRNATS